MKISNSPVIVTGAASGISRATARLVAQAGAHVIVGDVNEAGARETVAMIQSAGGKADFALLDLTDPASVDRFAEAAIALGGGRVGGLVNGAGRDRVEP